MRQRRKHEEWVILIEEQEQSAQTIKHFCAERGLAVASFQHHRSKWRQDRDSPSGFVELGGFGREEAIRIRLDGHAWFLEIGRDFDPNLLKRVLATLGL